MVKPLGWMVDTLYMLVTNVDDTTTEDTRQLRLACLHMITKKIVVLLPGRIIFLAHTIQTQFSTRFTNKLQDIIFPFGTPKKPSPLFQHFTD